ncbi:hypothetical protein ACFC1T_14625 [Kitasatospora sp. NPDC056076]|uniref:hypothetical protein n=1 Tax=Kitasatospora sp. NPDC056076 TaxID=3345703 RepID=UPI0035D63B18
MGLWSKLTGGQTASTTPTGRTPRERVRREREIRRIDNGTAKWLRSGGLAPKKRS